MLAAKASTKDTANAPAPAHRPRRLRRTATLRGMVRETVLLPGDFIYPFFVTEGEGVMRPISSMPGQAQLSVDMLAPEVDEVAALGIPAVLLFGIPAEKDPTGSWAWHPEGPVQRAIAAIKRRSPDTLVIADVCLCEYTDHGHCGILSPGGEVLNDDTLELLARSAVSFADAGADIVAPSAMMDRQVAALRVGLDAAGHEPFREAAQSAPQFGDRRAYQMDPANAREALREVALDVEEGADMLMVKPAGPYLDIIRQVRDRYDLPIVAYQVSGEYAMLKAASANGWLDERRVVLESLTSIKRAGADVIISYYAKDAVRWIREGA
jgi:porphobilinogen synthase